MGAAGEAIETIKLDLVQNSYYSYTFKSADVLPHGIYFIQYLGTKKKTIKLLK